MDSIVTQAQKKEINEYKETALLKSDLERQENQKHKTGVFTGSYAINPMSKSKIPIWVSKKLSFTSDLFSKGGHLLKILLPITFY